MRARCPDRAGHVDRDGVSIGFEVYDPPADRSRPTVVLMPTWTIVHAGFWKMQVAYLSRHMRVVAFDGPGNGRSQRSLDPARYDPAAYALDTAAVLDACGVDRAVVVGLSLGARYALELARLRPDSIAGLVLVGPAVSLAAPHPDRARFAERFTDPAPVEPVGWDRFNLAYWHAHYDDFTRWFFGEIFSEPHSTKCIDDAVSWAHQTTPAVLEAESAKPPPRHPIEETLAGLRCPTLVVHGTADRVQAYANGVEAARLSGGTLVSFEGSGHMPNLRDPVRFNLLLREFVERVR